MLWGDKNGFGVECVRGVGAPPWGTCHFTYWIGGHAVGNFHLEASINDLAIDICNVLVDRDFRRDDRLFALPASELVGLIHAGLTFDPRYEQLAIDDRWRAHCIGYEMRHGCLPEYGTNWSVYLVEDAERARIIFHEDDKPEDLIEQQVLAGSVDKTLMQAWETLNGWD